MSSKCDCKIKLKKKNIFRNINSIVNFHKKILLPNAFRPTFMPRRLRIKIAWLGWWDMDTLPQFSIYQHGCLSLPVAPYLFESWLVFLFKVFSCSVTQISRNGWQKIVSTASILTFSIYLALYKGTKMSHAVWMKNS